MIKKLVRIETVKLFREGEAETITDQEELNKLYALKIKEELAEIQNSDHKDIMEFVDLIEVVHCFAERNGFTREEIGLARAEKRTKKGIFTNIALNALNPDNPSNEIYFRHDAIQKTSAKKLLQEQLDYIHPDSYQSEKQLDQLKYDASLGAINKVLVQLQSI